MTTQPRTVFDMVLDKVRSWGGGKDAQASKPLSGIVPGNELWDAFTGLGDGLPGVSPSTVSQVTAVHGCVQLIAGAIASLPMNVYVREDDGEQRQLYDDPLWWILNEEFNPRWSAATAWKYGSTSQLLRGDAFYLIERRGSAVIGMRPLHPERVEVRATPDGRRLVYRVSFDTDDGMEMVGSEVYDQDDIIHVPGAYFDGLRSVPPLRNELRMAASTAASLQEYTARFFSQGARPDYIIKAEPGADLGPQGLADLRAQVDEYHAGLKNARRPMLLAGGLDVKSLTMPLEDVELLGLRQFQVEEIARAFGVPPFMIGHNEKTTSWGSGVEAMGVGFVRYTLRPYLTQFENELNRKLFRAGRKFVAFDTTELEQADLKTLFESFRVALGRAGEDAFMTLDEVRRRLKLKALPGGGVLRTASATAPAPAMEGQTNA